MFGPKPIGITIRAIDKKNGNVRYTTTYDTEGYITSLPYDTKFAEFMNNLQAQFPDCELEYTAMKD